KPRQAMEEVTRVAPKMGIELIATYATLGPYDVMLIYEAPDEMAAVGMALNFSDKWGARPETWTLIPVEELTS
ncbi:GYD domain-containing protein, partial [Chloroflexota bacterium]